MDNSQESQGPPPVRISLSTSSPTISLSGSPPFYVTTTYDGTSTRPIWALIYRDSTFGSGIRFRDTLQARDKDGNLQFSNTGEPRYLRLGPSSTVVGDFKPDPDRNVFLEDSELMRLGLGDKFSTSYLVTTKDLPSGLVRADTYKMIPGGKYEIYLNRKRGRWAYEDKMSEGNISEGERRRILSEKNEVFWKDDTKMTFEVVE
jgi:hypothetical protein